MYMTSPPVFLLYSNQKQEDLYKKKAVSVSNEAAFVFIYSLLAFLSSRCSRGRRSLCSPFGWRAGRSGRST